MTRWLLRSAALMIVIASAFALVSTVTRAEGPMRGARFFKKGGRDVQPAPALQSNTPGYTLLYSFSSDATNNTYVASFTPDVAAIYAWATVVEENGAAQKQFTVETQFVSPDGTPIESKWYENDTGTVTTYPSDAKNFGDKNVARRFIDVAGTSNAKLTGKWTVNYKVEGKLIASGDFTLENAIQNSNGDAAESAKQTLTDAGYTVVELQELKGKNDNLFAFVSMELKNRDLYSAETTQQIVDGLGVLRQSFPDSGTLYTFLRYDARYEVAYWADPVDVDAYLENNDFGAFAQTISVDVYDNQEGKYLGTSSKDFINKNFGGGTYQAPHNPPLSKSTSRIGSLRVSVSPASLPADGASKAIVTVTVYDKKNLPVPNAEVTFEVAGSAGGSIRPRVTSTDDNGETDAVFTVGKLDGQATITASSGGASGTGVITVGKGSSDSAADNVIGSLSAQGYNATKVGFIDAAKTTVAVLIDLGASYDINQISGPIIYGMTALRTNYPEATTLVVVIPYQENLLMFPATTTEYDALGKAITASKNDAEKQTAFTNFLNLVFAKAAYVDRNGKPISTFKDFVNKNFTGG